MNYIPNFRISRPLSHARRRGSAAILLSAMLLLLTTATAATTLRALAISRSHFEAASERQMLHAAIDAVSLLPAETLAAGIRLSLEKAADCEIVVILKEDHSDRSVLIATERKGGQTILSVEREFERTIQ